MSYFIVMMSVGVGLSLYGCVNAAADMRRTPSKYFKAAYGVLLASFAVLTALGLHIIVGLVSGTTK